MSPYKVFEFAMHTCVCRMYCSPPETLRISQGMSTCHGPTQSQGWMMFQPFKPSSVDCACESDLSSVHACPWKVSGCGLQARGMGRTRSGGLTIIAKLSDVHEYLDQVRSTEYILLPPDENTTSTTVRSICHGMTCAVAWDSTRAVCARSDLSSRPGNLGR